MLLCSSKRINELWFTIIFIVIVSVQGNEYDTLVVVLRESGLSNGVPTFPNGNDLKMLVVHEFTHVFLDGPIEAVFNESNDFSLKRTIHKGAKKIRRHRYGNSRSFLKEQVVRAATIAAMAEITPNFDVNEWIAAELHSGFHLTNVIYGFFEADLRNSNRSSDLMNLSRKTASVYKQM